MNERVDRDLDALYGGRVGEDAQLAGHGRDLPGQLDVALAQPEEVVGCGRGQSHGHAIGPKVDIGVVVRGVGEPADRVHQCDAGRERPGAKMRLRDVRHDPPVLDAARIVELLRRDRPGHAITSADPPRRVRPPTPG